MPAPTPIAAACIVIDVTSSIGLAQPIDLRGPPETTGARSFTPREIRIRPVRLNRRSPGAGERSTARLPRGGAVHR